jgi:phospholipid transport system substrate-binding protein
MNRSLRALRRSALVVCWLAAALAARAGEIEIATDTPAATIVTLQQGLIAVAERTPQATLDERYQALEPLIVATHDLPYIAEFSLRRQWGSLSELDRQRFVAAFQRLSVMTYAARFTNVGPETFRAVTPGSLAEAGRAQVSTAIARTGASDVSLDYLLQQGAAGWRIINIVADGVSDLALKRAEYQRVLTSGSLDTLIAELEAQTARLRED